MYYFADSLLLTVADVNDDQFQLRWDGVSGRHRGICALAVDRYSRTGERAAWLAAESRLSALI